MVRYHHLNGGVQDYRAIDTDEVNNTVHWVNAGATASEINDEIANATPGDTVRFEGGTYTVSNPITDQGKDNITLEADGMGSAVIQVETGSQVSAIRLHEADDWEIRHLEIDGQGSGESDGGDSTKQCGIYAESCNRLWVHHNHVHDTYYANFREAARGVSASDVLIANNIFDTTYGPAPADNISFTASDGLTLTHCSSVANHCLNCGHQAIEYSSNVNESIVSNNTVYDSDSVGLSIHDGKNNVIIGNYVNANSSAISLGGTNYLAIGNFIEDADGLGIKVGEPDNTGAEGRCKAVGNVINGSNNRGIILQDTRCDAVANTIIDAGRSAGEEGIRIDGFNCSAIGNTIKFAGSDGIDVGSESLVSQNRIYQPDKHGINVDNRCEVNDNIIIDPGQADSAGTGIYVKGGADSDIRDNYVENSPSQGIDVQSDRVLLVGNRSVDNANEAIRINEAANCLLVSNWLENSNRGVYLRDANKTLVATNYIYNNSTGVFAANPSSDCKDNRLETNSFDQNTTKYDTNNSTRTVRNGVGRNSGDPNSTGDWNGNGFEGVIVRDTGNNNTYLYNYGSWSQIASA